VKQPLTTAAVAATALAALIATGCGKPGVNDLRESFARQLSANTSVKDFQQSGDDLRFSGPSVDGGVAKWRVHLDSATIESNNDPDKPYKGIVKSSWYADDVEVLAGARESNLPPELISTGLAQDCWALWNKAARKWEWE
jgi:hypothetical protein